MVPSIKFAILGEKHKTKFLESVYQVLDLPKPTSWCIILSKSNPQAFYLLNPMCNPIKTIAWLAARTHLSSETFPPVTCKGRIPICSIFRTDTKTLHEIMKLY